MRTPLLTVALSLLLTGTVFADACTVCSVPPGTGTPGGPTTVNNGGNTNNSNSNSAANPINTSNTIANPQSQALSSNVNTQVNTVNNANFQIGNGIANCGAPALSIGLADTNQGAYGGGPSGYNSNAITGFIGAVIPLGHSNQVNCHAYQQTILAHSYLENCKFFFSSFPGVHPAKIQGFENCESLYVTPAVVMAPPVIVPALVQTPQVVYREKVRIVDTSKFAPKPPRCVADLTMARDLRILHNRRKELGTRHPSRDLIAAHERLERACVDSSLMLTALDG